MIIGLTGGIGSGKSIVARVFETMGCALFNSDQAAKIIYFDPGIKKQVIELLDKEAYISDTELNKSYISSKIFSNTDLLHRLNAIIHPAVKDNFKEFAAVNKHRIVIKETALLFEAKLEKDVDKIVTVAANDDIRIQRVMKRDGLTREEVAKKMQSQLPQEEKIKHSHFVIYNNGTEFIIKQVLDILNQLKSNA